MLKSGSRTYERAAIDGNASESAHLILDARLRDRSAHIAVLGLGYAGLPMAIELASAGFTVTGIDVDEQRVRYLDDGKSPLTGRCDDALAALVEETRLRATTQFAVLDEVSCALICVPTPLSSDRTPDLRYVESAAQSIAAHLHPGMLVVLQSTCSPGTTRQVVLPMLESSGMHVGEDFFLAFGSERIDPGNRRFTVWNTPKVVGGITPRCQVLATRLFEAIVERVVPVSSPEVAELSKLVENTFRFINISFVNEMALLCDRLGISIWEVVDAAATKPFAFMPHYPGPGVGGHCIPVVPFYLEAAARENGMVAELIEVAGRINDEMPRFVVDKLTRLLLDRGMELANAKVLVLGVAYKSNVADTRESPALTVLGLLLERARTVAFHDPYVSQVSVNGRTITSLSATDLDQNAFDCAVLLTPHDGVDYEGVARRVALVFDTRRYLHAIDGASIEQL